QSEAPRLHGHQPRLRDATLVGIDPDQVHQPQVGAERLVAADPLVVVQKVAAAVQDQALPVDLDRLQAADVAGVAAGIRFIGWFLDGPTRLQPGLKIDYASYLRTPARRRAWMHAAGA